MAPLPFSCRRGHSAGPQSGSAHDPNSAALQQCTRGRTREARGAVNGGSLAERMETYWCYGIRASRGQSEWEIYRSYGIRASMGAERTCASTRMPSIRDDRLPPVPKPRMSPMDSTPAVVRAPAVRPTELRA